MTPPFSFHRLFHDEVRDAYQWYERQTVGLGDEFIAEVEAILGRIEENRYAFGKVHTDIRAAQTNRFPYAVYYRVLADRVRVLALYHHRRDPSGWQERN